MADGETCAATARHKVSATTAERQRPVAWLTFLAPVEREMAPAITTMHVGLAHLRRHQGNQGQAWLAQHPRFVVHLPPVHGSWMHQVEPWCSIVQRKRWPSAACADTQPRAERWMAVVAAWNEEAHPVRWSTQAAAKVMAQCENLAAKAA